MRTSAGCPRIDEIDDSRVDLGRVVSMYKSSNGAKPYADTLAKLRYRIEIRLSNPSAAERLPTLGTSICVVTQESKLYIANKHVMHSLGSLSI